MKLIYLKTLALLCFLNPLIGQEKEHVINFLENRQYAQKSPVECVIDQNNIEIPNGVMKDLKTGLTYGINNTHKFEKVYFGEMMTSEYTNIGNSISELARAREHYLFIVKILNFDGDIIDSKKEKNIIYHFNANLKTIDMITGEVIFATNINTTKSIPKNADLKYGPSDVSEHIAKIVRERTTSLINLHFPSANVVSKPEEIKGDKVNSISASKLKYMKQGRPDKSYAHIVDKTISKDGKESYTFSLVGILGNSSKNKNDADEIILKVRKGKKKLLEVLNTDQTVYITTSQLGPTIY